MNKPKRKLQLFLSLHDIINVTLSIIDPLLNYIIIFFLYHYHSAKSNDFFRDNIIYNTASDEQQQSRLPLQLQLSSFFLSSLMWTSSLSALFMIAASTLYWNVGFRMSMNLIAFKTSTVTLSVQILKCFLTVLVPLLPTFHLLNTRIEKTEQDGGSDEETLDDENLKPMLIERVLRNNSYATMYRPQNDNNGSPSSSSSSSAFFGGASKFLFDKIFKTEYERFERSTSNFVNHHRDGFSVMFLQSVFSTLPSLTAQLIAFSVLDRKWIDEAGYSFLYHLHLLNAVIAITHVSLKAAATAVTFSRSADTMRVLFVIHDLLCFAYTLSSLFSTSFDDVCHHQVVVVDGGSPSKIIDQPNFYMRTLSLLKNLPNFPFSSEAIDLEELKHTMCFTSDIVFFWFTTKAIVIIFIFLSFFTLAYIIMFVDGNHSGQASRGSRVLSVTMLVLSSVLFSVGSIPLAIIMELCKLSVLSLFLGFSRASYIRDDLERMILLHNFLWNNVKINNSTSNLSVNWRSLWQYQNRLISDQKHWMLKELNLESVKNILNPARNGSRVGSARNLALIFSRVSPVIRRQFAQNVMFHGSSDDDPDDDKLKGKNNNKTLDDGDDGFFARARHTVLYHQFHTLNAALVIDPASQMMKHHHSAFDMLSHRTSLHKFIDKILFEPPIGDENENGNTTHNHHRDITVVGFKWYHFICDPETMIRHFPLFLFPGLKVFHPSPTISGGNPSNPQGGVSASNTNNSQPNPNNNNNNNNRSSTTRINSLIEKCFSLLVGTSIFLTFVVSPFVSFCFPFADFFFSASTSKSLLQEMCFYSSLVTSVGIIYFIPEFCRFFLTSSLAALFTGWNIDAAGVVDSYYCRKKEDLVDEVIHGKNSFDGNDEGNMMKQKEKDRMLPIPEEAFEKHLLPFLEAHHCGLWGFHEEKSRE